MSAFKETPCNDPDCTFPDCKCWEIKRRGDPARIPVLVDALRTVVNELEAWNLTEGDPETVEAIKKAKAALSA